MQITADPIDVTGLWTTADGAARKLLLPNGRYLVKKAYAGWRGGDYAVVDAHIEYHGDDGATGTARIADGVIHSPGGVLFYAEDGAA